MHVRLFTCTQCSLHTAEWEGCPLTFYPGFLFKLKAQIGVKRRKGLDLKQDGDPEMTALLKAFRFRFLSL